MVGEGIKRSSEATRCGGEASAWRSPFNFAYGRGYLQLYIHRVTHSDQCARRPDRQLENTAGGTFHTISNRAYLACSRTLRHSFAGTHCEKKDERKRKARNVVDLDPVPCGDLEKRQARGDTAKGPSSSFEFRFFFYLFIYTARNNATCGFGCPSLTMPRNCAQASCGTEPPWEGKGMSLPEPPSDLPRLVGVEVACGKRHMRVQLQFSAPFHGIVFSKGHHGQPDCVYVGPKSGIQAANFDVFYDRCGTKPDHHGSFYENTIVVQYGVDIIEAWDEAKRLRCEWHDAYEKSALRTPSIQLADLDVQELNFQGDSVGCWMEIQEGEYPGCRVCLALMARLTDSAKTTQLERRRICLKIEKKH
ncbi:hypothetical protein HPB48_008700 [Haemaphysalis longicornis]|uniref:ZP domain-containing protein n=1 Tax=Haemaphysalis longicornis TaxID=44386 RepID=A0A9J6G7J6_HAELO|nr:hypothetical protein HPB48_008700 [Haemaphysalis longicornis]